jgi:hypothetical protein
MSFISIAASSTIAGVINVQWTGAANTNYKLYWGTELNDAGDDLKTVSTNGLTYTGGQFISVYGLTHGSAYYFMLVNVSNSPATKTLYKDGTGTATAITAPQTALDTTFDATAHESGLAIVSGRESGAAPADAVLDGEAFIYFNQISGNRLYTAQAYSIQNGQTSTLPTVSASSLTSPIKLENLSSDVEYSIRLYVQVLNSASSTDLNTAYVRSRGVYADGTVSGSSTLPAPGAPTFVDKTANEYAEDNNEPNLTVSVAFNTTVPAGSKVKIYARTADDSNTDQLIGTSTLQTVDNLNASTILEVMVNGWDQSSSKKMVAEFEPPLYSTYLTSDKSDESTNSTTSISTFATITNAAFTFDVDDTTKLSDHSDGITFQANFSITNLPAVNLSNSQPALSCLVVDDDHNTVSTVTISFPNDLIVEDPSAVAAQSVSAEFTTRSSLSAESNYLQSGVTYYFQCIMESTDLNTYAHGKSTRRIFIGPSVLDQLSAPMVSLNASNSVILDAKFLNSNHAYDMSYKLFAYQESDFDENGDLSGDGDDLGAILSKDLSGDAQEIDISALNADEYKFRVEVLSTLAAEQTATSKYFNAYAEHGTMTSAFLTINEELNVPIAVNIISDTSSANAVKVSFDTTYNGAPTSLKEALDNAISAHANLNAVPSGTFGADVSDLAYLDATMAAMNLITAQDITTAPKTPVASMEAVEAAETALVGDANVQSLVDEYVPLHEAFVKQGIDFHLFLNKTEAIEGSKGFKENLESIVLAASEGVTAAVAANDGSGRTVLDILVSTINSSISFSSIQGANVSKIPSTNTLLSAVSGNVYLGNFTHSDALMYASLQLSYQGGQTFSHNGSTLTLASARASTTDGWTALKNALTDSLRVWENSYMDTWKTEFDSAFSVFNNSRNAWYLKSVALHAQLDAEGVQRTTELLNNAVIFKIAMIAAYEAQNDGIDDSIMSMSFAGLSDPNNADKLADIATAQSALGDSMKDSFGMRFSHESDMNDGTDGLSPNYYDPTDIPGWDSSAFTAMFNEKGHLTNAFELNGMEISVDMSSTGLVHDTIDYFFVEVYRKSLMHANGFENHYVEGTWETVDAVEVFTSTKQTSTSAAVPSIQLDEAVISAVAPKSDEEGGVSITFSLSNNAPVGQSYELRSYEDAAMTTRPGPRSEIPSTDIYDIGLSLTSFVGTGANAFKDQIAYYMKLVTNASVSTITDNGIDVNVAYLKSESAFANAVIASLQLDNNALVNLKMVPSSSKSSTIELYQKININDPLLSDANQQKVEYNYILHANVSGVERDFKELNIAHADWTEKDIDGADERIGGTLGDVWHMYEMTKDSTWAFQSDKGVTYEMESIEKVTTSISSDETHLINSASVKESLSAVEFSVTMEAITDINVALDSTNQSNILVSFRDPAAYTLTANRIYKVTATETNPVAGEVADEHSMLFKDGELVATDGINDAEADISSTRDSDNFMTASFTASLDILKEYTFSVVQMSYEGFIATSSSISASIVTAGVLSAPSMDTASLTPGLKANSLKLKWRNPNGAENQYFIQSIYPNQPVDTVSTWTVTASNDPDVDNELDLYQQYIEAGTHINVTIAIQAIPLDPSSSTIESSAIYLSATPPLEISISSATVTATYDDANPSMTIAGLPSTADPNQTMNYRVQVFSFGVQGDVDSSTDLSSMKYAELIFDSNQYDTTYGNPFETVSDGNIQFFLSGANIRKETEYCVKVFANVSITGSFADADYNVLYTSPMMESENVSFTNPA